MHIDHRYYRRFGAEGGCAEIPKKTPLPEQSNATAYREQKNIHVNHRLFPIRQDL